MNANAIQEKILSDARTSASDIMRDANEKAAPCATRQKSGWLRRTAA